MNKNALIYCLALTCMCVSSRAFAYGEGWSDEIPIEGRQMHLLINEARADVKEAISTCPESLCRERSCYTGSKPPYYWNDALFKASQLHSNMLKYRDEALGGYKGIGHDSPCKLVSNIGTLFPGCDGRADCACQGGKYSTSGGTGMGNRVRYFTSLDTGNYYSGWGETIAQAVGKNCVTAKSMTTGTIYMTASPAYYYYLQLMSEGDVASGTKNVCNTSSNGNGHRFAILSGASNTIGCGMKCVIIGGEPVCAQTCDYGSVSNPIKNTLTAGSHYKEYSTLWFKTHYYSNVNVKKVTLSIGDQCVELKQTRGSAQNAVFGTSELSDINECTPYFFESMDANGGLSRFPSTGSLVYIPVEYSTKTYCNGKTWKKEAGSSCICGDTQHFYNNSCEPNTVDNCGSHDNSCAKIIEGWSSGECNAGKCVLSACQDGFHVYEDKCEESTTEHCGEHGNSCQETVPGWADGACVSEKCVVSVCQEGYHRKDDACVSDSASDCGPDSVDCTIAVEGWGDGNCEQNQCVVTICKPGYHLYENQCELDTVGNCGQHGVNCQDTVEGWKSGECVDQQCTLSECIEGYKVTDNQCAEEEPGGEENPPGGEENPPGGEENPPGGEENPPGGEENPPGGEENPPGGEEQGSDEDADASISMQSDTCSASVRTRVPHAPIWILFGLFGAGFARRRQEMRRTASRKK